MRRLASAVVLSMVLAAPAFADTVAPGSAVEQVKIKTKKKGGEAGYVVCSKVTPTGSLFSTKVCTTAAQRKSQGDAVQTAQDRLQNSPVLVPR